MVRLVQFYRALAGVLAALLLTLVLAVPSAAQGLSDYGKLLGGGSDEQSSPQQSTPAQSTPTQSQPQTSSVASTPSSGPTVADYGRVAESLPDPMLDATRQAVEILRFRLVSTF